MHKQATDPRRIISASISKAKGRHKDKNKGRIDGCALTADKVAQKIIDLGGWCGISRVVPMSFNKQNPFLISIEDLPGTARGYGEGGWTVCAGIFNLTCRPITADFAMLGQGRVEYRVTEVPRPGKIDGITVKPVKPRDGREFCCICWVLGDKESMPGKYCQDCQSWYTHTMPRKLAHMAKNGLEADYKRKRPGPVNLSTEKLQDLLEAQGGRCAVSGLPFARGVKCGERYSAFAISLDRLDNNTSHDLHNVRLVCSLFNPVDGNQRRKSHGVNIPPAGLVEPYTYSWTPEDYALLLAALRVHAW